MAGAYLVWYHEDRRLHRVNWWHDGETAFRMVESYTKLGYEPWLEWMALPMGDQQKNGEAAHQHSILESLPHRETRIMTQPKGINWGDLYDLYVDQHLSISAVAHLKGCCHHSVIYQLRKREIPLRRRLDGLAYWFGAHKGANHPNWRGGKYKHQGGYILVYNPEHPYARRGYVFEHRLVMEAKLGRFLLPHEKVHHLDGNKENNPPENLVLLTQQEHTIRTMICQHCVVKKEVRLLRWQIKELNKLLQMRLEGTINGHH